MHGLQKPTHVPQSFFSIWNQAMQNLSYMLIFSVPPASQSSVNRSMFLVAGVGCGNTSNPHFYILLHFVSLLFPCSAYVFSPIICSSGSETSFFFFFLINFESWVTFSASKRFLCCCKMYCKIVMHNYTQPFPSGSLPSLPLPSQTSSLSLPFAILLYLSRALALPMEMTMMLQQCRAAGKERN